MKQAVGGFVAAFLLAACAMGLPAGCLWIEYNQRQALAPGTGFGLSATVDDGVPLLVPHGDTPETGDAPLWLVGAPVRLALDLLRSEVEGVKRLTETVLGD